MIILIINILLTAIISGFMFSYCITLGSYFNYLLKTHADEGFAKYYSAFRKSTSIVHIYGIFVLLQFLVAIISLILNWNKLPIIPQLMPILAMIILQIIHNLVGFGKSETSINSGEKITEQNRKKYLQWNIPLHLLYALLYAFAAVSLMLIA